MKADAACEVSPRLGATMPLRLAVAFMYAGVTTAKPEYFLCDMAFAMLANLLHMEVHLCPYHEDPEFKIYPRYNALPTGNTTCGKSPSFNLLTQRYVAMMKQQTALWPFATDLEGNLHSDGSHGLFNEKMRHTRGHVLFAGPEAVNYLSPEFPERGRCDKTSYADIPRLLDLSTGGRYKWGTATEVKEARALLRRQSNQEPRASATAQAAGTNTGGHASASSLMARDGSAPGYQPICFERTNVNLCWYQQVDLLRQWWVPAERKRHLGFVGRFLLSFSLERSVPPGQRRAGGLLLLDQLERTWVNTLLHWGPRSHTPPQPLCLSAEGAAAWSEHVSRGRVAASTPTRVPLCTPGCIRKWEYWAGTAAALNHIAHCGLTGTHSNRVDDNALKCAFRFLDQRFLFGANVLAAEMGAAPTGTGPGLAGSGPHPASSAASSLSPDDRAAAELLRSVPEHIITHSVLAARVSVYRRRPAEAEEALRVRRSHILEHVASLGFGACQQTATSRNVALHKFPLTPASCDLLRSWEVPVDVCCDFFPAKEGASGSTSSHASNEASADPAHAVQQCGATQGPNPSATCSTEPTVPNMRGGGRHPEGGAGGVRPAKRQRVDRGEAHIIQQPLTVIKRPSGASSSASQHVPVAAVGLPVDAVRKRPAGPGRLTPDQNPRMHTSTEYSAVAFHSWDQFKTAQKAWAMKLMPGRTMRMNCQPRVVTGSGDFKYKIVCTTCEVCKNNWGRAALPMRPRRQVDGMPLSHTMPRRALCRASGHQWMRMAVWRYCPPNHS